MSPPLPGAIDHCGPLYRRILDEWFARHLFGAFSSETRAWHEPRSISARARVTPARSSCARPHFGRAKPTIKNIK
jgi:hypothetical protein